MPPKKTKKGKGVVKTVVNKIKNKIPDSDANARPAFPGERHAVLRLPNGKRGIGNYIGQHLGLSQGGNALASPYA